MHRSWDRHRQPAVIALFQVKLTDHAAVTALHATADALARGVSRLTLQHHHFTRRELDGRRRQGAWRLRKEGARDPAEKRAYPGGAAGLLHWPVQLGAAPTTTIYAREQVGHVWLVDPLLQTLEVLRLDGPGYRIAGVWRGDVVAQCQPFETLALRLADLWSA